MVRIMLRGSKSGTRSERYAVSSSEEDEHEESKVLEESAKDAEEAAKDAEEKDEHEEGSQFERNEEGRVSGEASKDPEGKEGDEPNGSNEDNEKSGSEKDMEEENEAEDPTEEEEVLEHDIYEPIKIHFRPGDFTKGIKIQSRCYVKEAVKNINEILNANEKKWFHQHPQFKHFFHMPLEKKNKVQGMWMLFLHAVGTGKKREAWFVVNGVPIRYSLREHGLLSGLYCHNYPIGWEAMGGLKFVGKHFLHGSTISYEVIEEKFLNMEPCRDSLRMAILYFFSSVITGKSKKGEKGTPKGAPSVEHFFLRAVDDLKLCKTFPWGRLSFDDNLQQMNHLFKSFGGVVDKKGWCYTSFNIPLHVNYID